MKIILLTISVYLYSALVEYCLHRFYLHSSYKNDHILKHHSQFNGKISFEDKNANNRDILSGSKYNLVNIILSSPIIIASFLISPFLGIYSFVICSAYIFWIEYMHLTFHKPKNSKIEETILYKSIKKHHKVHHELYNNNYGIGSSTWDLLLCTNKKDL